MQSFANRSNYDLVLGAMKRLALTLAFTPVVALTLALALNAYGVTDNNQNGREGNPGHVYSVPESGSTALLLGLGLTVMVVGRRAFA
jgi:hypothetical protein